MKKIGVAATLAILSLLPTGCVNLEALRQLSDTQTIGSHSGPTLPALNELPEYVEGPAVPTTATIRTICRAWAEDHEKGDAEYFGKVVTIRPTVTRMKPNVGDMFEFGWDEDVQPRKYYTEVNFNFYESALVEFKDFSRSTDWKEKQKYTVTGQIVGLGHTGTRCHIKLSNGYKYRLSSKAF
ncbi:hypothetical protein [Succinivibrio dextrinosolvens]|uniref:hypothetical protein n=1 Tax=Succinivibrio dextrinosolvens TaxID=83771 RepID=UPI00241C12D0|nr:hypothetical protein [Succinivibrio dextrinosolvens]MBE6422920.1 hypothetical protein [Succinivibrio dextrinosolvens]